MNAAQKKFLADQYYGLDKPASFSNANALLRICRKENKNISLGQIKDWLSEQEVYTLHAKVRKRFPRNKIKAYRINEQFQVDLCDVSNISNHNDGIKFLLTTIDVLSRYAFAVPLKNKFNDTVVEGFKKIFKHRKPDVIQSDSGTEFLGSKTQSFLKSEGVRFFQSKNEVKCAIIERWIRTLKSKMYKIFTHRNSYRYIDVLDQIVESYNNTHHRSIKMAPSEVNEWNEYEVFLNLYGGLGKNSGKFKFQIGDTVRISELKGQFQKGYLPGWSTELFTITKRLDRAIPVYKIKDQQDTDIDGTFYEYELIKFNKRDSVYKIESIIKARGKGSRKQYYVSWYNYPAKFNSWVNARDIEHLK